MENEIKFEKFGKELFEKLTSIGLTSITKTDMDALILDLYLNTIGKGKKHSSYELMKLFKVTPSKLRSMELVRTMKYKSLDIADNQDAVLDLLKRNAKNGAFDHVQPNLKGMVTLVIDDAHLALVIEKWVTEKLGPVEYTLNTKLLKIPAAKLIDLLDELTVSEDVLKEIMKDYPDYRLQEFLDKPVVNIITKVGVELLPKLILGATKFLIK